MYMYVCDDIGSCACMHGACIVWCTSIQEKGPQHSHLPTSMLNVRLHPYPRRLALVLHLLLHLPSPSISREPEVRRVIINNNGGTYSASSMPAKNHTFICSALGSLPSRSSFTSMSLSCLGARTMTRPRSPWRTAEVQRHWYNECTWCTT